jgi:hypothetical protein
LCVREQVLAWLSQQGLFPIEYIVHVDPDFFKRIMPEVLACPAASHTLNTIVLLL